MYGRGRPAGLQQRAGRRCAAGDDRPDALHRPGLHQLRRHQRRHQRFTAGNAAMMMNWPFMWMPRQRSRRPRPSPARSVRRSTRPGRPAPRPSTAPTPTPSPRPRPNPELARKLIEFYLDPRSRRARSIDTGWLPIRLSVLNDPEVQEKAANAAVGAGAGAAPLRQLRHARLQRGDAGHRHGDPEGARREPVGQQDASQTAIDQVTAIVKRASP